MLMLFIRIYDHLGDRLLSFKIYRIIVVQHSETLSDNGDALFALASLSIYFDESKLYVHHIPAANLIYKLT